MKTLTRVEASVRYPCRIIHLLKIHKWVSMCLCYIHEPWMSIRVFLSEYIFRHGYYHGHCIGYYNLGKEEARLISFMFQTFWLGKRYVKQIHDDVFVTTLNC